MRRDVRCDVAERRGTAGTVAKVVGVGLAALAMSATLALGANAATPAAPRAVTVGEPVARIVAAAEASTLAARSVTIEERLLVGGKLTVVSISGRYPARVRIAYELAGASVQILLDGPRVYVEMNAVGWETLYRIAAGPAAALVGHWYTTTTGDASLGGSLADLDPKVVERALFAAFAKGVRHLVAHPARVGGQPAIALRGPGGAFYVAAHGAPHVLRITISVPGDSGFLEFSGYGATPRIALPASATSLDAALLASQAPPTTVPPPTTPVTAVPPTTTTVA
ncbi:MAG TPA: hypothetical protein VMV02_03815 [Acidimicrobiales bacterium]|nr:hypothetical protein [Acidimicrobiales bacterium]